MKPYIFTVSELSSAALPSLPRHIFNDCNDFFDPLIGHRLHDDVKLTIEDVEVLTTMVGPPSLASGPRPVLSPFKVCFSPSPLELEVRAGEMKTYSDVDPSFGHNKSTEDVTYVSMKQDARPIASNNIDPNFDRMSSQVPLKPDAESTQAHTRGSAPEQQKAKVDDYSNEHDDCDRPAQVGNSGSRTRRILPRSCKSKSDLPEPKPGKLIALDQCLP